MVRGLALSHRPAHSSRPAGHRFGDEAFGALLFEETNCVSKRLVGYLVVSFSGGQPSQVRCGEGDADGEMSASPDPQGRAKHLGCILVAALIRVDLPQVVHLGGRSDYVSGLFTSFTAPGPVFERQVPVALVVGPHSQVVENVGLADQVPELLVHRQGLLAGRLAGRVVEVRIGRHEHMEGVRFRFGIGGTFKFFKSAFAPFNTGCERPCRNRTPA